MAAGLVVVDPIERCTPAACLVFLVMAFHRGSKTRPFERRGSRRLLRFAACSVRS